MHLCRGAVRLGVKGVRRKECGGAVVGSEGGCVRVCSQPVLRLVSAAKALTATGTSVAFLREACEQAVEACGMWGGLPAGGLQESTEAEH